MVKKVIFSVLWKWSFFLIVLLGFSHLSISFAKTNSKDKAIEVVVLDTSSFKKFLLNFTKKKYKLSKKSKIVRKTIELNPHIKKWRKLKKGTVVKVYLPANSYDKGKVRQYLKKVYKVNKRSKHLWKGSTQFGKVDVQAEDGSLVMDIVKVAASYVKITNSSLSYNFTLAVVKFLNIDYSRAIELTETKGFLPEFTMGFTHKVSSRVSIGASYNYLNYFIANDLDDNFIAIAPKTVHRVAMSSYYKLTENISILFSGGFIEGPATGFDGTLGVSSLFGTENNYSASFIVYRGQLNVDGEVETSNAMLASLGYIF